jgi:rhodanese-related sulfurtransferase
MSTSSPSQSYAGDLSAREAYALLESDPKARLIDVRTMAEWNFVGLPDLRALGRETELIEWQSFPSGQLNPGFTAQLAEGGTDTSAPLLFLCRSGARSRSAAIAATAAGYAKAYNVAGGFEGDLDGEGHRGAKNGWKASGLDWKQT